MAIDKGYVPAPGEKDLEKLVRAIRNLFENGAGGSDLTTLETEVDALTTSVTALELPGRVINRSIGRYDLYSAYSAVIPNDDTIPQISEGALYLRASITPRATANIIRIRCSVQVAASNTSVMTMALFREGAGNNAIKASQSAMPATDRPSQMFMEFEQAAGSTSIIWYAMRFGIESGVYYLNGNSSGRRMGGTAGMTMIIEEIAQ